MIYFVFYVVMVVIAMFTGLVIAHYTSNNDELEQGAIGGIICLGIFWPVALVGAVLFLILALFDLAAQKVAAKIKQNFKK